MTMLLLRDLPAKLPDPAASIVEALKSLRASSTSLSIANGANLILAIDSYLRTIASNCLYTKHWVTSTFNLPICSQMVIESMASIFIQHPIPDRAMYSSGERGRRLGTRNYVILRGQSHHHHILRSNITGCLYSKVIPSPLHTGRGIRNTTNIEICTSTQPSLFSIITIYVHRKIS